MSANTVDASAVTLVAVTLDGAIGADTLKPSSGSNSDTLPGGGGTDTVVDYGDVSFTLTDSQLTGKGTDSLATVEQATLTGGGSAHRRGAPACLSGALTFDERIRPETWKATSGENSNPLQGVSRTRYVSHVTH